MTYNTGNPIGSTDPRDLYDNAEALDELVNSKAKLRSKDRLGASRKTYHGIEKEFTDAQSSKESRFVASQEGREDRYRQAIADAGYQFLGDYAGGITLTEYNQVLRDAGGDFWRAAGATSLPYTTTGAGVDEGGSLTSVGDAVLRQDLAGEDGVGLIGSKTGGLEEDLSSAHLSNTSTNFSVWEPRNMGTFDPDEVGAELIWDSTDRWYPGYIETTWDTLLEGNGENYVTKETLGPDSSGNNGFDVFRYVLTPKSYDRTIIIVAGQHGGEKVAMFSLYLFINEVVNNWQSSPHLAHIRKNTRLVIIPVANPIGFYYHSRQNENGVDLNRNYDYRWDEAPTGELGDQDYKGPAPFSELETQYIRDTLDAYSPAVACIDLHNYSASEFKNPYPYYMPAEGPSAAHVMQRVTESLMVRDGGGVAEVNKNYLPSLHSFAAKSGGMYSANPEFNPGLDNPTFSSGPIRECARFHGNTIIGFALEPILYEQLGVAFPKCETYHYTRGEPYTMSFSSSDYAPISRIGHDVTIPSQGYVKYSGFAVIGSSEAAEVAVAVECGQNGQGKYGPKDSVGFSDISLREDSGSYVRLVDTDDRAIVHFSAVFPVERGLPRPAARINLHGKTSAGVVTIYRYVASAEFVPSPIGDKRVRKRTSFTHGFVDIAPYY